MADKITILIIDDEIISRYTLGALLESEERTLVFAEDGLQGLAKAKSMIPDLILLDVMMPGVNGFEVCRRIREDPSLAEVPIVMVTGFNDDAARSKCFEKGANEVICKPFDRDILQKQVDNFVHGKSDKKPRS